ncbi:MAG: hypothetical protein SPH02_03280 [Campylobacter sp.]|nr:hypothetical protein [Campylobacter sp.]
MKKIVYFFAGFIGYMFLVGGLFLVLYAFKIPPFLIFGEEWLRNTFKIKEYINAQTTQKPRLLIVSGSNSLFGFNSALIKENTQFHPINLAAHAGLPFNFYVDKIIANAKNGDYIFLPLEFDYYTRPEPKANQWYIHNMLLWGDGYAKYISQKDILQAYFSAFAPLNLYKALLSPNALKHQIQGRLNAHISPIPQWESLIQSREEKHYQHDFKSLNAYGDFAYQKGTMQNIQAEYLSDSLEISDFFLSQYRRLESFAQQNNIKLFLIYPVSAENPHFSLQDTNTFKKIENLQTQLTKHNIQLYGDFTDSHFEEFYFYDTNLHLNSEGAKLRTMHFIKMLEKLEILD